MLFRRFKACFERIGGVPRTLWFDNLSAAVVSIQTNGQRVVTDAFQRYYRFESTFCNPGKGNEKGHVENKVGYSRRNWCVLMPFVFSLEELQQTLDQKAEQDLHSPHYEKEIWMNQLWAEEQKKFYALPLIPYDVIRIDTAKVDKYGRIKMDNKAIDLSSAQPGDVVLLKIRWNQVEIVDASQQKINTIPRPYMDQERHIEFKMSIFIRVKSFSIDSWET